MTARFNTTDPKEQNFSPYLAMGNSPVNQIDPDGGFSGSWVGAAVGAGIGLGVAAYLDYKDNGKFNLKDNWWKYAAFGAGDFVVGGIAGGIIEKGQLDYSVIFGYEVRHAKHLKRGINGWFLEKTKPGTFWSHHGFSMGFRYGNTIVYNIVVGNPVWRKPWDINFPRIGTGTGNTWEFFKKIPSTNRAFYPKKGPSIFGGEDVPHAYSGFRWFFHECFDDTLPTRRQAKKHR